LFITHEPDVLLRELAQRLSITERHAHGILNDLVEDGFLTKTKEGRRNRYEIQADIPVPEVTSRELPVGSFLEFLAGA
jgi:DNA-binding IclR family transcriptional regulator